MNREAQSLTDVSAMVANLTALLPRLQQQLKDGAVREAVAGGAAVVIRPEYFPRPTRAVKGQAGEVDPWFGLTQMDWAAEMAAGFAGWYATTENSARPKVMINYEKAREWLGAKMARQRGAKLGDSVDGVDGEVLP